MIDLILPLIELEVEKDEPKVEAVEGYACALVAEKLAPEATGGTCPLDIAHEEHFRRLCRAEDGVQFFRGCPCADGPYAAAATLQSLGKGESAVGTFLTRDDLAQEAVAPRRLHAVATRARTAQEPRQRAPDVVEKRIHAAKVLLFV